MCLEVLARFAEECYQLGMKYQCPVDDKLFIFLRLAADNTSNGQFTAWFDGGDLLVSGLFSSMSQLLPEHRDRLIAADVASVRVNDFRTRIKVFTTRQPRAVPGTKSFFH
jgi:hypothetical protein